MKKVLLSILVIAGMALVNQASAQSEQGNTQEGVKETKEEKSGVNHNTVRRSKKTAVKGEGKENGETEASGSKSSTKKKTKEKRKGAAKKKSDLVIPRNETLIFIEGK